MKFFTFSKKLVPFLKYADFLKYLVSITEANQNFSKIARLVDENRAAVILKKCSPLSDC